MARIAILGATVWGTTIGLIEAQAGRDVAVLCRTEAEAARLAEAHAHPRLPGVALPESLHFTASAQEALGDAAIVIPAVPCQTMRSNVEAVCDFVPSEAIVVSASKGIEVATGKRMSEVLAEALPGHVGSIGALSGPNLARELAAGMPAATVVAASDPAVAEFAREGLQGANFRVYSNTDVVGVELGGALKNVIALAAGIADGLRIGDNAKAGMITRGLAEISRLGVACGANPLTFMGLSGLGDLICTCASTLSRNHQVGARLATGMPLPDILAELGQVAEGVTTTQAAREMARRIGVDMPITNVMHAVMFEGLSPRDAVHALFTRESKAEIG